SATAAPSSTMFTLSLRRSSDLNGSAGAGGSGSVSRGTAGASGVAFGSGGGVGLGGGSGVSHWWVPQAPPAGGEADRRYQLGVKEDRKSTRLNSSHVKISYAGLC